MANVQRSPVSDFVKLMHLPLPLCVLAFATIGFERVYLDQLLLTYLGILLALCLGAYSLDELRGSLYICNSLTATLLGVSIVLLTHRFRPQRLSKKLGSVPNSDLIGFSRYARKAVWTVVQLECYAMIALAIGLIIPKLI